MAAGVIQDLEDDGEGLFDNDWPALQKAAIASGPAALRALLKLLKRLFPRGHTMIEKVQAALDKAEADEKAKADEEEEEDKEEARKKLRKSMQPK